jgi:hypothetical protein
MVVAAAAVALMRMTDWIVIALQTSIKMEASPVPLASSIGAADVFGAKGA